MSTKFELHRLGWKAFEDLVGCVLSRVLGQTAQVFAEGPDGGRDGAFRGKWSPDGKSSLSGNFVIQCKHTTVASSAIKLSSLEDDFLKAGRLVTNGECDIYILITNHALSASKASQIAARLRNVGVKEPMVYGAEWINSRISQEPVLRRLVPRLYGLGDLSQVITNQAYQQARAVLDGLLPDLKCFVPTEAYRRSAHALAEDNFVLLLGEPASGKTMIANLLAISAADQWNLQTLMLTSPHDFDNLWNPEDPGQFIWVDDAFGATQYDQNRVREWNHRLPKLKAAIHSGAKVVFTSRDYVFNAAKLDLKLSAFDLFEEARVTIRVEELSEIERRMILYNHLKEGSQPKRFLKSIIPYLNSAAAVPRFLPEVARRLGSPKFTKNLSLNEATVVGFFENPMQVLEEVIQGLGAPERTALGLVFINGGRINAPISHDSSVVTFCESMGTTVGDVKSAFASLDDSLLARNMANDETFWRFRHPTIGDAFASVISRNPELIEVYLRGVRTERLMHEVTCGDMGIEGVKIVVPQSKFDGVIARLRTYKADSSLYYFQDPVQSFLATRCSDNFLSAWFHDPKDIKDLVADISRLSAYSDPLKLLRRIEAAGLLPPDVRLTAAAQIKSVSRRTRSLEFNRHDIIGGLLTNAESIILYSEIVNDTLSSTRSLIEEIRLGWDGESDPEDCFYELRKTLNTIAAGDLEDEAYLAEVFQTEICEEIEKMENERTATVESEELDAKDSVQPAGVAARSIFDDLAD